MLYITLVLSGIRKLDYRERKTLTVSTEMMMKISSQRVVISTNYSLVKEVIITILMMKTIISHSTMKIVMTSKVK